MMVTMFIMMVTTFMSSAQIGRVLSFGDNGFNLESNAFQKVQHLFIDFYDILMSFSETAVTSQQGCSLNVSLVIDPQGQNKKTRVLSASYEE